MMVDELREWQFSQMPAAVAQKKTALQSHVQIAEAEGYERDDKQDKADQDIGGQKDMTAANSRHFLIIGVWHISGYGFSGSGFSVSGSGMDSSAGAGVISSSAGAGISSTSAGITVPSASSVFSG